MQKPTAKRRVVSAAPMAAIVLQAETDPGEQTRYGLALLVFMRGTAALWMTEGLLQWGVVLTSTPDGGSLFTSLAAPAMAAAMFFAVVNFVAAVGLWLAAPWGGVIWLVAVGAQILVLVIMPNFFDHPLVTGLLDVALMSAYLALVWFAAQPPEGDR